MVWDKDMNSVALPSAVTGIVLIHAIDLNYLYNHCSVVCTTSAHYNMIKKILRGSQITVRAFTRLIAWAASALLQGCYTE